LRSTFVICEYFQPSSKCQVGNIDGIKLQNLGEHFIKVESSDCSCRPQFAKFGTKIRFDVSESGAIFGPTLVDVRHSRLNKGLCECCRISYCSLSQHVQSEMHLEFSRNLENYHNLDELIHSLPSIHDLETCADVVCISGLMLIYVPEVLYSY